jgi:hypothetical protein
MEKRKKFVRVLIGAAVLLILVSLLVAPSVGLLADTGGSAPPYPTPNSLVIPSGDSTLTDTLSDTLRSAGL